ncbi:hypothetical protein CERSUDRAFT_127434 [Gelatoporia subvermispora B]|uniref:F-box domain-containing protein n=1 Tax=Ceriporiopsis subvermispora (strain B) TaxID=914234 RepID=M2QHB5_CERS8|nr:hypothetical protein CERSUDRAFT_127434 [Gelatoporia subvermispora B]
MQFASGKSHRHGSHSGRKVLDALKLRWLPRMNRDSRNNARHDISTCPNGYSPVQQGSTSSQSQRLSRPCPHRRPITRLPDELLVHIFILAAQDDVMAPLTVTHICRYWRYLARQTAALWRRVALDSRLRLWNYYFHLSKACTLDIELRLLSHTPSRTRRRDAMLANMSTVELSMHLATRHIQRWRSLSLQLSANVPYLWNTALVACCVPDKSAHAPALRELRLVHPFNDDTKEFMLFDGHAPHLSRVTLCGIRLIWLPSLFQDLTYLDYTHHGFTKGREAAAELLYMLEVSCRLRELRLVFSMTGGRASLVFDNIAFPSSPVQLPCLTYLKLSTDASDIPSAFIYILEHISLPSLNSLSLCTKCDNDHVSFSRLRHVRRAIPPLPALTRVTAEGPWADTSFLSSLLRELIGVHRLTLASQRLDEGSLRILVQALYARAIAGSPLRVLDVGQCGTFRAREIVDAVERYQEVLRLELILPRGTCQADGAELAGGCVTSTY